MRDPSAYKSISGTQFLTLSLFLLLLAFFIAMTAGAEFDENKTDPVIDSLEKVFPVRDLRGPNNPSERDTSQSSGAGDAQLQSFESFLTSEDFPFDARTEMNAGALVVSMNGPDLRRLLDRDDPNAVMTPLQRQRFFAQVDSLLDEYDMTLVLPAPNGASAPIVNAADTVRDGLIVNGIAAEEFRIGAAPWEGTSVRLVFTDGGR